MIVDLPRHVWRTVRHSLRFQRERLAYKADRSASETSAGYDRERVDSLDQAITALDRHLNDDNERAALIKPKGILS